MDTSKSGVNESELLFTSLNNTNHLGMMNQSIANTSSDILIVDNNGLDQLRVPKSPKKVLHFCDGTIEEYSSDDEDETDNKQKLAVSTVDPKTLPWGSWLWYQTMMVGNTSLKVCDYLGEGLASFLGITTPKYQFEIDEYKRMMAEEEESKKRQDLEMGGWTEGSSQVVADSVRTSGFHTLPHHTPIPTSAAQNDYGDSMLKTDQRY